MERDSLLMARRFWPLFWVQFLGAFNDNVFKNALVILIAYQGAEVFGLAPQAMVTLSAGIFILPFVLFSATAGQLADKFSKARIIRAVKFIEVLVMAFGAYGFFTGQFELLIAVLFFMGAQSALFGPAKFGVLPEITKDGELVRANGLVSMGTFLAILLGTLVGGILIANEGAGPRAVAGAVVVIALAGYGASRWFVPLAPDDPSVRVHLNPVTPMIDVWRVIRSQRPIYLAILGTSWFWFFGASFLALFPNFVKDVLHGDEGVVTLFLALFSVGIGLGSMLCAKLSRGHIELGLVPLGAFGMTLFSADLYFATRSAFAAVDAPLTVTAFLAYDGAWRVVIDMLLLAVAGGFYIVPLQTLVQERTPSTHRSRVISAANIMNAGFMVLSSLVLTGLTAAAMPIPAMFLVLAALNLLVAAYIFTVIPEFMYRFLAWCVARVLYRIEVTGDARIPAQGAAVLVCNHVTFVDWLIVAGACRRPARFVMYHKFMTIPFVGWFFRTAKVIPIAPAKESRAIMESAFDRIAEALDAGQVVCIFPEGALTRDGNIAEFRAGIERIVARNPVPVIPMALRGMWGSWFSRFPGDQSRPLLGRLWHPIHLTVGEPVAAEAVTAPTLRDQVAQLRGEMA